MSDDIALEPLKSRMSEGESSVPQSSEYRPDKSVLGGEPPPRSADILFRSDKEDWETNACIASFDLGDAYSSGYRTAGYVLAEKVCTTHKQQDRLVYPIVYLYRHHVELVLKSITVTASALLDKELTEEDLNILGRHGLSKLWENLKPLLNPVCELVQDSVFPVEDIEGIDSYINQLHAHDPDGQRFRYATVKKQKKNVRVESPSLSKELRHINIRVFATSMERLADYLESIDHWFGDLLDVKNDMKRRGL